MSFVSFGAQRVMASNGSLKDKSGVDKIIVKKQPYQLLNTTREFFLVLDDFKTNSIFDTKEQNEPL